MKRLISRLFPGRAAIRRIDKRPVLPARTGWGMRFLAWSGRFMRRAPYHLDLVLPGLVLLAAGLAVTTLAMGKAGELIAAGLLPGRVERDIEVRRLYLERGEYEEYSPTLARLNPGVNFMLRADGALLLEIPNEELFPDLMMALHTLQSFKPGVAWEMVELCVRTCPEKAVARVAVKGFKQELR